MHRLMEAATNVRNRVLATVPWKSIHRPVHSYSSVTVTLYF